MNGPIRRVTMGLLACFVVLLAGVSWYQVIKADELRADPRNPRPLLSDRGKERGLIVTADGVVVAESLEDPNDPRSFVRRYPEGEAFAHMVGYSSFVVGDSGLERSYATTLRSRRDLTISDLIAVILGRDLRPQSLELTIDAELQRAAFEALDGQTGAVVALDPKTGAILALVSSPSFDPESLMTAEAQEAWDELLADPDRPLADRATRELYPPGSTFKTLVTGAAFDSQTAAPETEFADPDEFDLPGSTATISNAGGGPCNDGISTTLLRAFIRSCNTIFADLSIQVGAEEINASAHGAGFNRDFDFPWSIPQAAFPVDELSGDPAALAQSGIGERDVRATPLHMAMVAASIANGGSTMTPYLVNRVFDADGSTTASTIPEPLDLSMTPASADVLTQLMERVVTEGTGRLAAVPGVRVAGKTGTSSGPGGLPNPWFIGFAPVENPTIAIAVLIERGGSVGESASGGGVAAPIASELIETWLTSNQ